MARYAFLPQNLTSSTIFCDLLRSCILSKSLKHTKTIHGRLLKTQFCSEIFILNRLMDTYAKCECFSYAQKLFDTMLNRNIFTWNILIDAFNKMGLVNESRRLFFLIPEPDQCSWNLMVSGFAQNGCFDEAMEFFRTMYGHGFMLNAYSFSSALKACAGLMDLTFGERIHALLAKDPLYLDVYMGSALVGMYSKCKRSEEAQKVFDEMPYRNLVSWNSLITCYEQNGPPSQALFLFLRIMCNGFVPDEITLASVASACASLAALREGKQIHARVMKFDKLRNDLVLCNALVDMYVKCDRIDMARFIFDRTPYKSVVSKTSMISGYAKCGNLGIARIMFSSFSEKNLIAWNALIAGYAQSGEVEEALKLFLRLKRENFWPTNYTFGNVLNTCASLADLQLGKQLHVHVLKQGFCFNMGLDPDIFVGNSLMDMYFKSGSVHDGAKVFEKMVVRDIVSWNSIIGGYAQNGHGEEALHLFKRMLLSGEKPDSITMIGVLSGCSHAGLVNEANIYFNSMTKDYGIVPNKDHHTCMVDLLGRAGQLKEAKEFISKMPFEPDKVLWASLLAACRLHKCVEMGEWVAKKLFEIDNTSGPYVLLSNMYAEKGRWKEADRVRKEMKEKGVVKQPGCSWIEIEREIHVFLVKDKRHPCAKEIYGTLNLLQFEMYGEISMETESIDELL